MTYPFLAGLSSTPICVNGSGWQSGISDQVRLAARIAASRAACSGSPLATSPRRMSLSAVLLIVIEPRATASRSVTGLAPTSTIFTRPRASTCESFLATVVTLCEIEPQALQRHGQVHALQLHVVRHMQRAWREVENPLDAGGHDLVDDRLRVRRRYGNDRDVEPLATGDALEVLDVVDRNAATRLVADLLVGRIEHRGNLEALLAEAWIVGEREAQVAGADDRDAETT